MFKLSNRNTRTKCEICSNLTLKTPERRRPSGIFSVKFEHISYLVLVFLLLTLSWKIPVEFCAGYLRKNRILFSQFISNDRLNIELHRVVPACYLKN